MSEATGLRTIGEILDVPAIRTVVSLEDRQDRDVRRDLLTAFVPTEEALRVVQATARRSAEGQGSLMVMGGYGSGKSHLLLVLAELGEPRSVLADRPWWPGEVGPGLPLVVPVSLVEHAAARPLEEILLEVVAHRLGCDVPSDADRRPRWQAVSLLAREAGHSGVLLLVDELSAYLRARMPVSALREDVRLLQYLGEQREFALTVVATLQESLEQATEADPEAVRRLRDRYVTLPLTGAHLETVVTERLLRPRAGHAEAVAQVESRLRRAFGTLPWDPDRLRRLYPVHPGTLEHLVELRHSLSATRGALDFLYRQLRGDPEHGTPALLGAPVGTWLTPDRLFGHFSARLAEAPETAPLVDRVGSLYRTEGERLFGSEAALAGRIADFLCVEAAGLRPRARTSLEVAQALALTEFGLDPGLAEVAVGSLLEAMTDQGAYVVREDGPSGVLRYRIDAQADAALVVRRRLESALDRIRRDEASVDRRVILRSALAQTAESLAVPVSRLMRERETDVTVRWQQTERTGVIWCGDLRDLVAEDVTALARENEGPGHDFTLVVALPGDARDHADVRAHLDRDLLPALAGGRGHRSDADAEGSPARGSIAFWVPAPLPDLDLALEVGTLAELRRDWAGTESEAAQGALKAADMLLHDKLPALGRTVTDRYFAGEWILGSGESLGRLDGLSLMGFQEVLSALVKSVLEGRHPAHGGVMPRLVPTGFPTGVWSRVAEGLLAEGEVTASGDPEAVQAIEGVLVPLGLAGRHGHGFQVRLDPQRSLALAGLLGTVAGEPKDGVGGGDGQAGRMAGGPERVARERVEQRLMKGPLGLDRVSARLTILAAILGGLVTPYARDRRVPLARLRDPESLDAVDAISLAGSQEARSVPEGLRRLPFLAGQAEGAFLPARQRELWARVVKWKAEHQGRVGDEAALVELSHHPVFRDWEISAALEALAVQSRLLDQVAVSLTPQDGLRRVAEASEDAGPDVGTRLQAADAWSTFLKTEAERLITQDRYLRHVAFAHLDATAPELGRARRDLLASLSGPPGLITEEARAAFSARLQAFVEAYMALYVEVHRARVGSDPTATLTMLEKRHGAPRDAEEAQLRQAIHERHCRLTPGRTLAVDPVCPCGFQLGDPPLSEDLSRYAERLSGREPGRPPLPGGAAAAWVERADGGARSMTPATPTDAWNAALTQRPVRQLRDLTAALSRTEEQGLVSAAELRRRFEAWLMASSDEEIEIRP